MASSVTKTSQIENLYDIFHTVLTANTVIAQRYGTSKHKFLEFEPQGEHGIPGYPFVVIHKPSVSTDFTTHRNLADKLYSLKIEFYHDYSAKDKCVKDVDACTTQIEQSKDTLEDYGLDDVEVVQEMSDTPEKKGSQTIIVGEVTVNFTVDLDIE